MLQSGQKYPKRSGIPTRDVVFSGFATDRNKRVSLRLDFVFRSIQATYAKHLLWMPRLVPIVG